MGRKVGDAALQLISGVTQSEALRAGQTASARALRAVSILALRHPWPANTNALGATHLARYAQGHPWPTMRGRPMPPLASYLPPMVRRAKGPQPNLQSRVPLPYGLPSPRTPLASYFPWPARAHSAVSMAG